MTRDDENETIEIKRLSNTQIREDGKSVNLTFETLDNQFIDLALPAHQVNNLAAYLFMTFRSAMFKQHLPPRPDDKSLLEFNPAPPVFFVSKMECVVFLDSGALDLQLQDDQKKGIHVCLTTEQVKRLFEHLLETCNLDNDQKPN